MFRLPDSLIVTQWMIPHGYLLLLQLESATIPVYSDFLATRTRWQSTRRDWNEYGVSKFKRKNPNESSTILGLVLGLLVVNYDSFETGQMLTTGIRALCPLSVWY